MPTEQSVCAACENCALSIPAYFSPKWLPAHFSAVAQLGARDRPEAQRDLHAFACRFACIKCLDEQGIALLRVQRRRRQAPARARRGEAPARGGAGRPVRIHVILPVDTACRAEVRIMLLVDNFGKIQKAVKITARVCVHARPETNTLVWCAVCCCVRCAVSCCCIL